MDCRSLKGKKVLFFYPDFFGYGEMIQKKMEELDMEVKLHNSKSVKSAFGRALFKIVPEFIISISKNYFMKILIECRSVKLDYILVVERLPIWFLKRLRIEHPKAKFILYMDDSIKNLKNIEKRFYLFDRIYSFDKQDALKYEEIIFRPLFYSDETYNLGISKKEKEYKYDICFLGTCHSDRYRIIKEFKDICRNKKLRFYSYLYLQSRFMYYYYKITDRTYRKSKKYEFNFDKKSYLETMEIQDLSRVIMDIQHIKQTGLTMRTIEMIGMRKKLITTNISIKEYDFYNPKNILVIDRNNIQLDDDFFVTGYEEIDPKVMKRYSLKEWICNVLEEGYNAEV